VLSDNGREFCGREDRHPYELFRCSCSSMTSSTSEPGLTGPNQTALSSAGIAPFSTSIFASRAAAPGSRGRTPITALIDGIRKEVPTDTSPIRKAA
jgi:hypothetical protein